MADLMETLDDLSAYGLVSKKDMVLAILLSKQKSVNTPEKALSIKSSAANIAASDDGEGHS
jgi:hypothetical protein